LRHSISVAEQAQALCSNAGQYRSANFLSKPAVVCDDDRRVVDERCHRGVVEPLAHHHVVGDSG
jgi:hypothetical protein